MNLSTGVIIFVVIIVSIVIYQRTNKNVNEGADGTYVRSATTTYVAPKTFTYYAGKDSNGGDMIYFPDLANNVPALKSWCVANPNCKGFNTNGFMKSTIKTPAYLTPWPIDTTKGVYLVQ